MNQESPQKYWRKDYAPCDYVIRKAEFFFDLGFEKTVVRSRLHIHKNHQGEHRPLQLDGEYLELLHVWMDEVSLDASNYNLTSNGLTLYPKRDHFLIEIENALSPEKNLALEGLYKASNVLLTQCEPHGFRRITYFIDRPDNMSAFSARLEADKDRFPYLLCNGNFVARGDLPDNRHFVQWEDPHPKPSYLFALVAGDFHLAVDQFTTRSGRRVELELYVDKGEEDKCQHAIDSLKRAMKWDEDTYGLEYDLDLYMIVATNHFNMGAMENKGLNIFSSVYVLAHPETATDSDYQSIESVIGHEYFHNWSGNRVTCRDWFQLTLKEGLTVYRDQEFSADLHDATVKRIEDVQRLREVQFLEDAGPNRHPIRPDHYIEINNFYTPTVYEKGAEVIRMIEKLVGKENFKKGLRLYFERHDGEAATCEDFLQSITDATGFDLSLFINWYQQPGTPKIEVRGEKLPGYYEWHFHSPTLEYGPKLPLHIPLDVAWFNYQGHMLGQQTAQLKGQSQSIRIPWVEERPPVLSVNRGFSVPAQICFKQDAQAKKVLALHERDGLSRYEAIYELFSEELNCRINGDKCGPNYQLLVEIITHLVEDQKSSPAELAAMTSLPTSNVLMQSQSILRPGPTLLARKTLSQDLSQSLLGRWEELYLRLHRLEKGELTPHARNQRAWKNRALQFLVASGKETYQEMAHHQLIHSKTMTDGESALRALCGEASEWRTRGLSWWEEKWYFNDLVMNKWLSLQATSEASDTLAQVNQLRTTKYYKRTVPHSVYALFRGLLINPAIFHSEAGVAHATLQEEILALDSINPQVAARLVSGFNHYRCLPEELKKSAKTVLENVLAHEGISANVYERASNILKG